jgi:hypothetical protein
MATNGTPTAGANPRRRAVLTRGQGREQGPATAKGHRDVFSAAGGRPPPSTPLNPLSTPFVPSKTLGRPVLTNPSSAFTSMDDFFETLANAKTKTTGKCSIPYDTVASTRILWDILKTLFIRDSQLADHFSTMKSSLQNLQSTIND